MKHDAQDCFHVSASEAEVWKRAVAAPPESVMLAAVPLHPPAARKPLFGSLPARND